MQYSSAILIVAFAATSVYTHGVVDSVVGANGVSMPGLSGGFIPGIYPAQLIQIFTSCGWNSPGLRFPSLWSRG